MSEANPRWDKLLEDSYCVECLEFVPMGAEVRPIVDDRVRHIKCQNGDHEPQLPQAYAVDLTTGVVLTRKEWQPEREVWGGHREEELDQYESASRAVAVISFLLEKHRTADKDWSHVDFSGEYPKVRAA